MADSLREILELKIKLVRKALLAHADKDDERHLAEREARQLASDGIRERLEGMNELRKQLSDERGRYVSREFYDEQHSQLRTDTDNRLKVLETNKANMEGRLWAIGAAISGGVVLLNIVLYYFRR